MHSLMFWSYLTLNLKSRFFKRKSPPSVGVMDFLVMLLHCHHSYGNYDGCRLQLAVAGQNFKRVDGLAICCSQWVADKM